MHASETITAINMITTVSERGSEIGARRTMKAFTFSLMVPRAASSSSSRDVNPSGIYL